jgi:hypothetical protein
VTLRANRFAPFAHALFGVAREHTGLNGVDFTSPQTDSGFATLLGGGLDFIVTRRLKVRAIEVDYLRADVFNQTQNNAGISSGITFGFGTH